MMSFNVQLAYAILMILPFVMAHASQLIGIVMTKMTALMGVMRPQNFVVSKSGKVLCDLFICIKNQAVYSLNGMIQKYQWKTQMKHSCMNLRLAI